MLEAKDFHIPQLKDMVPVKKTKPRGTSTYLYPQSFWCVGRFEGENKVLHLSHQDWSYRVLTAYPRADAISFVDAFCVTKRKVFVIGLGKMNVFDLENEVWEPGPPPLECVRWPASAVRLNSVFVCGGRGHRTRIQGFKSVDQFKLGSWRWIQAPDMKFEHQAASAVFLKSSLHVIGGYPDVKKHERLDTRTNTWSELSPWSGGGGSPGVTVYNGEIHVAGGGDKYPILSDVYVYDARKNEWRLLLPMMEKRQQHGLLSFDGNMYAVGGRNTLSVELYDGTEWKVVARLDLEKCERACIM